MEHSSSSLLRTLIKSVFHKSPSFSSLLVLFFQITFNSYSVHLSTNIFPFSSLCVKWAFPFWVLMQILLKVTHSSLNTVEWNKFVKGFLGIQWEFLKIKKQCFRDNLLFKSLRRSDDEQEKILSRSTDSTIWSLCRPVLQIMKWIILFPLASETTSLTVKCEATKSQLAFWGN